jgi:hypothetical protein
MFCTECGRDMQERDNFCASCGVSIREIPLMPEATRLAGHLRMLGILWLAVSAFRFVPGIALLIMIDHGFLHGEGAPQFLAPLVEGIAAVFIVLAVAGVITGWGLLTRQRWARMMAIIVGAVNLIDMPFGTALGIYTFWVLLPVESEQQYERITRLEPASARH